MKPRVVVVGDIFRDRNWIGTSTRTSPEANVPVVQIDKVFTQPGGADNVCYNLTKLGCDVILIKSSGNIPIKNRLYIGDTQVARWDENDVCDELILDDVTLGNPGAVIISDYGKGAITYDTIDRIADWNVPTFVDSKRPPYDFDTIRDVTFFPNLVEYRRYVGDYSHQPKVVVKRGADGIEFQEYGHITETLPAWGRTVLSVCGAGDTVIAAYVFATLTGRRPLPFANAAAGVVVGKPYTAVATVEEVQGVLRGI